MLLRRRAPDGMWLVAGLGNPGKKYLQTRHNVGFLALDCVASRYGVRVARSRFQSLAGEGVIGGTPVILIKPLTFMNLSGQAVAAAAGYYRIPPSRILLLCDDVALPPGKIRIRGKGSSGGQKGLQSVESCLGSRDYSRIRIGVGDRADGELADYVLGAPSKEDRELIEARMEDVAESVKLIVGGELSEAQSRYNT